MQEIDLLCMGCMKKRDSLGKCQQCGFDFDEYQPALYQLKPQTILKGRYLIGRVLGEGGFGITYIGWDLNLEIPLAIKEYFPNGFVTRDTERTDKITVFSGETAKFFHNGREKFLDEARILGKFYDMDGIVEVKDFFLENETAYIVMEYLEGVTLSQFLKSNGNKLSPERVFGMMRPVMEALKVVHEKGLVHRDISPDNIMITKKGKIKLLDFGATREISEGNKSLSILLKPGYAPEEQYRVRGKQGPWTDIYALCATMYRAITGIKPMEALDRFEEDKVKSPSKCGIVMDSNQEYVLMKGMAIRAGDRWQNVEELYNALYLSGNNETRSNQISLDSNEVLCMQSDIAEISSQQIYESIPQQLKQIGNVNKEKYISGNNLEYFTVMEQEVDKESIFQKIFYMYMGFGHIDGDNYTPIESFLYLFIMVILCIPLGGMSIAMICDSNGMLLGFGILLLIIITGSLVLMIYYVNKYKKLAILGNAEAQYRLGNYYYNTFRWKKSLEYYKKSAAQGYERARIVLLQKQNKKMIDKKRRRSLGNAMLLGAVASLSLCITLVFIFLPRTRLYTMLGDIYSMPEKYEEAVKYYEKAADKGFVEAWIKLGNCYDYGHGVEENNEEAVYWYKKAAEAGNADGQYHLGYYYYWDGNYEKAVYWFKESAWQGNIGGQNMLGDCYYEGKGVEKDEEEAVYWYKKAYEQGSLVAKWTLEELKKENSDLVSDIDIE